MEFRRPIRHRLAILPGLLLVLALFPRAHAAEENGGQCPPNLTAWRTQGRVEPGAEWGAGVVEIRGDVGILRKVLLRFSDVVLPEEESRWFDAPAVLDPVSLHTRTISLAGEELPGLCRELSGPALQAAADRAGPRCFVTESGATLTITTETTVKNAQSPDSGVSTAARVGLAVGAGEEDGQTKDCAPIEELSSTSENADPGEGDLEMQSSVAAIFAELERKEAPLESGLPALPPARHVLTVLGEHDEGLIPAGLPSEFHLTAAVASRSYAEALALERMLGDRGVDEEVALKLLGDEASSAAVPLLRWKLRESVSESRGRVVGLTLRALLAADPEIARVEAMALLEDPVFARGALGVFALTEPELREELESLDLQDGVALAEAGRRVLAFLEATGIRP